MSSRTKRVRANRKRAKARARDANPMHMAQDVGAQGNVTIPFNFLASNISGVAPSVRRTLTWVYNAVPVITAGLYSEAIVVKLNSPYDPDAAVGGASAQGFAKYMQLYSKSFTLQARARIKFSVNGAAGAGVPATGTIVGMTITTNLTTLSSISNAVEQGLCDYRVLNQCPDSGQLDLAVNVSKFVNKPDLLDDPQFFCTSGADPSQLVCLHFWNTGVGASNSTLSYVIEVEMDTVFTDPIPFS